MPTCTNEIWKEIPDTEGMYEVSNMGRVRSYYTNAYNGSIPKILTPVITKWGYHLITYKTISGLKRKSLHRLVLDVFVGGGKELQCNHKNGVKTDNRLSNLEWVTASQNMIHSYDTKIRKKQFGEMHGMSKLTAREVFKIRSLLRRTKLSTREIAKMFNVSKVQIYLLNKGDRWPHITHGKRVRRKGVRCYGTDVY